jgi:hypothetical protein
MGLASHSGARAALDAGNVTEGCARRALVDEVVAAADWLGGQPMTTDDRRHWMRPLRSFPRAARGQHADRGVALAPSDPVRGQFRARSRASRALLREAGRKRATTAACGSSARR